MGCTLVESTCCHAVKGIEETGYYVEPCTIFRMPAHKVEGVCSESYACVADDIGDEEEYIIVMY
jgi:hypothetical protein